MTPRRGSELLGAGMLAAMLLGTSACAAENPRPGPSPAPTSTVRISTAPTASPTETVTEPPNSDPSSSGVPEHGPINPDNTSEPTDATYLSVQQVSVNFVTSFYVFGYPDGYARDFLERAQPYMTSDYFFEQLDLVEDAGANADPFWQQLTREHRRSIVEVGRVTPGRIEDSTAVSRVELRIAVVPVDSNGRTEKMPDTAAPQFALLKLTRQSGTWKVNGSDLLQRS